MLHIRITAILSGVFALTVSLIANSAVYKCKDEQGHISYSQSVCPEAAKVDKIIKLYGGRSDNEFDVQCGLVNSFAAEIGIAVDKKRSLSDTVRSYGGVTELSPTALKIIRSVYEYQSQPYKTVQNSVNYEKERCMSEIYGAPDCSQFPVAFISSYGGCAAAADTNLRLKRMSANSSDGKLKRDNHKTSQRVASATKNAHARNDRRVKQCREDAQRAINRSRQEARRSQSASSQDIQRAKQRELKERLARCGG